MSARAKNVSLPPRTKKQLMNRTDPTRWRARGPRRFLAVLDPGRPVAPAPPADALEIFRRHLRPLAASLSDALRPREVPVIDVPVAARVRLDLLPNDARRIAVTLGRWASSVSCVLLVSFLMLALEVLAYRSAHLGAQTSVVLPRTVGELLLRVGADVGDDGAVPVPYSLMTTVYTADGDRLGNAREQSPGYCERPTTGGRPGLMRAYRASQDAVDVDCGVGHTFALSKRNEATPHVCVACRCPASVSGPSAAAIARAKRWWLSRYSLYELRRWPPNY